MINRIVLPLGCMFKCDGCMYEARNGRMCSDCDIEAFSTLCQSLECDSGRRGDGVDLVFKQVEDNGFGPRLTREECEHLLALSEDLSNHLQTIFKKGGAK